MSDIPLINIRSKRKKSEDHGVMQNLEASSLAILETTENTDDVSDTAKKDGNSIYNDSPPAKKKKRTCKPRNIIKDQPRETPCLVSRPSFRLAIYVYVDVDVDVNPVGQAVELGQQLQNFALHIVDSQSADERATQVEWLQRAKAAKASLTASQEMPSVAPNEGSQSASEELDPAPSSNMPPVGSMQSFSDVPTNPTQSGQHYMAPLQGMSVPGSFAAPQYPPAVQRNPAAGFMNHQGHPFQGVSHHGPVPYGNRPQCPIRRLESTLNRVAASIEANNRLMQQILAQGDQNTSAPVNFNR
ncbi:hypothetical protein H9Q72_000183 [Fusarium xylarioides]|uniref:Uncharacterized protein n=1 Tax=Fusarium xylarioides TaxID=221167 RepID=A0A9P7IA75_9HYPO|nr:hypothetical protein H9Q72_000183 [Fusarium xylarioides]